MSPSRAIEALRAWPARWAQVDRFAMALRLTLLDLLLQPVGEPIVRFASLIAAGIGLAVPTALRSPLLWWGLTCLLGWRVGLDWPLADNHAYLVCYWCGAIALAFTSEDPDAFLAHNGRWMIGLVFLFATLWKAWLSPEFTTGVAFRVTLLVDPRFEDFTRLAAGVPLEWIEAQRALLARHADGAQVAIGLTEVPRRLAWIAWIGTCWTLLVEGLVALCFLWPLGRGPSTGRDWLLMCFCATTYSVATVASFGWLLVAMGFSQCDPAKRRTRLVYGLLFALILFYREVPWLSLAADRWAPG